MADILSNQFTSTVSRTITSGPQEILSNRFTTTITRSSDVPASLGDSLSTVVNIYKSGVLLTPVNSTPTTGQYQVTITGTTACTASVQSDYKTIKLNSITDNKGSIDISINIENKRTYIKSIPVGTITSTQELNSSISQVEQASNKINWLVKSGTSSSNMELTADAYNVISKNINLTAGHIKLEGYTTINGGFSVDTVGNMSCTNANVSGTITGSTINGGTIKGTEVTGGSFNVEGTLTAGKIVCTDMDSPKYPGVVTEDLKLYVSTGGNDDSELEDGATFETFDGLLDKLPKNLNGHEVRIEVSTNITENVEFRGYHGGRIRVLMNGRTLYGYVRSVMGSAKITIHSGHIGDNNATNNGWGKIHPSKGCAVGDYTTTVASYDSGSIALYNIDVYGADNYLSGSTTKLGVAASDWGAVYMNGVSFYGCNVGARANAGGRIHDALSHNVCTKYGFYATTGGYITLVGAEHSGGKTKNYHEADAGKVIVANGATFAGGEASVPGGSAPVITTKTVTVKSTSGDTYRSSVYNSWKKDNTVRQGDYGYGDCNGIWLFGDQFEQFKGKNITKVVITISRQEGGQYASVDLNIKTHNYKTRPSGKPSYVGTVGTLGLEVNTSRSKPITDTSNAIITGLKAGTIKGIGLQTTYDSAHYAVCSGSVTIKVTYTE